jgi:uncharacterized protein YjbI with pentapeptide repeats
MKGSNKFAMGFIIGVCLAGTLGILYLSLLVRDPSFLSGFIASTGFFLFSLIAFYIWIRKSPIGPSGQDPKAATFNKTSNCLSPGRVASTLFFMLTGVLMVFLFLRHNELIKTKTMLEKIQLARQTELIETTRNSGLVKWMAQVLQQADEELKTRPGKNLSEETIDRISALSYSFKPYAHVIGDSISLTPLSPERGQLLMVLSRMDMDSVSFSRIMRQASFSGAALREADLGGANLKGVDLKGADLYGANLEGTDLKGADLSFANLWGAHLNNADMKGMIAKRADFRWAELNGADLNNADLHEADLTSAKLRKADLSKAVMQWADLTGAFLNEANMTDADMFRVDLKRAQLTGALLNEANLTLANFSGANLTRANLTGAELNEAVVPDHQWLVQLNEWPVTGALEIQEKYRIVDESSKEQTLFQLRKIQN